MSFATNELLVEVCAAPVDGVGLGGGGIGGFLGECEPPCGIGAGCTE